jgi:hypothetical protein
MELTPNTLITRKDLMCPDKKLKEIFKNVVCCTDCDFVFKLDGNRLFIGSKGDSSKNVTKATDNTEIVIVRYLT